MSDIQSQSIPQPAPGGPSRGPGRQRRRLLASGAVVLLLVAGGGAAARAWSVHHFHHHGGWMTSQAIPVDLVEQRVDRMLRGVDATPDQQTKLHGIIEAAAKDLDPLRKDLAGTRAQMTSLLTAPQIDRAAVEQLRTERVAEMDQASKRVTQALLDAADVLTPDQRKKLADNMAQWQAHRRD